MWSAASNRAGCLGREEATALGQTNALVPTGGPGRVEQPCSCVQVEIVARGRRRLAIDKPVIGQRISGQPIVADHDQAHGLPRGRDCADHQLDVLAVDDRHASAAIIDLALELGRHGVRVERDRDGARPRDRRVALDHFDAIAHDQRDGVTGFHAGVREVPGQPRRAQQQLRVAHGPAIISERHVVTELRSVPPQQLVHRPDRGTTYRHSPDGTGNLRARPAGGQRSQRSTQRSTGADARHLGIVRSVDLSRRDHHGRASSGSDDSRARHVCGERGRRERGSTRELDPNSVRLHIVGTPFLAEIRIMSFGFPPRGWAQCNGQFLPINQNQALFALLGTMYGGNGQTTFALPDLRGRVPMHTDGASFLQGQVGGETAHTVTVSELSPHLHDVMALSAAGSSNTPSGNQLAVDNNLYAAAANQVALVASAVSSVGGSQAHENRQPFLALMFCIALIGIFPSQN